MADEHVSGCDLCGATVSFHLTGQSNISFLSSFLLLFFLICFLLCVMSRWTTQAWASGSQERFLLYTTYQHIPYLVTIVNCTDVGSATASFKDLVTVA